MADTVRFAFGQGIKANSGNWYRNLQTLGVGGNAVTILALATSGPFRGVPFAVKVFRKLSKPERRENFLREIDFLRGCSHPSIMRIYDEGVFLDEHPFVVAEYLPLTLRQVIRGNSAATSQKISYVLQLLSALEYLDSLPNPVIHRDIKPDNVFVKGNACVLGDFGLMKSTQTADPSVDLETFKDSLGPGMPWRYRTPDLVNYFNAGVSPTTKSDIFQLGLVLAELFSGRNPQRQAVSFDSPVELDSIGFIAGAMAAKVKNLIERMLTPSPDHRDPASHLIDPWQALFIEAAERSNWLNGRVFG